MFSAKEYRAKAAEYAERGRTAEAPNEILEYENLWRRYAEMADNREWVERNFKKTMHDDREADDTAEDAEDQRILRCLGVSVILHWNNLPKKLQKELFDSAGAIGDLLETKALRAQIARFLHEHKDDRSEAQVVAAQALIIASPAVAERGRAELVTGSCAGSPRRARTGRPSRRWPIAGSRLS